MTATNMCSNFGGKWDSLPGSCCTNRQVNVLLLFLEGSLSCFTFTGLNINNGATFMKAYME